MKKLIAGLLLLSSFAWYSYAGKNAKNWETVTIGAGSTTIKAAVTGRHLVVKGMIINVENACQVYLFSGSAAALNKIGPDFRLSAKGAVEYHNTVEAVGFTAPTGAALQLWASADPGTDAAFVVTAED